MMIRNEYVARRYIAVRLIFVSICASRRSTIHITLENRAIGMLPGEVLQRQRRARK